MKPTTPHSREREARYDLAEAHQREHFPVCADFDRVAVLEREEMERHWLAMGQIAALRARLVAQQVRPLEGRVKDLRHELKPTG